VWRATNRFYELDIYINRNINFFFLPITSGATRVLEGPSKIFINYLRPHSLSRSVAAGRFRPRRQAIKLYKITKFHAGSWRSVIIWRKKLKRWSDKWGNMCSYSTLPTNISVCRHQIADRRDEAFISLISISRNYKLFTSWWIFVISSKVKIVFPLIWKHYQIIGNWIIIRGLFQNEYQLFDYGPSNQYNNYFIGRRRRSIVMTKYKNEGQRIR